MIYKIIAALFLVPSVALAAPSSSRLLQGTGVKNGSVTLNFPSVANTWNLGVFDTTVRTLNITPASGAGLITPIRINNASDQYNAIAWNKEAGNGGLRFISYNGATPSTLFTIYDNGAMEFKGGGSISSVNGLKIGEYYIAATVNGPTWAGKAYVTGSAAHLFTVNDGFTGYTSAMEVQGATAATPVLAVKAKVSQTANLQEWRDSSGTVLSSVDASGRIRAPLDPQNYAVWFDDFLGGSIVSSIGWLQVPSGSGAAATVFSGTPDANHPGIITLSTGTTTTGFTAYRTNSLNHYFGSGAWNAQFNLMLDSLCDATEDCVVRVGWGDINGADFQDGVYLVYDRSVSANWYCYTSKASSRFSRDSGVAVAATTWYGFRLTVNSGATAASFKYNTGSGYAQLCADITTQIPNTNANGLGFVYQIVKKAGTTARTMNLDYFYQDHTWATARE